MSEHDLVRLLDVDSDATEEERALLRSDRGEGPPDAVRAAMWANISIGAPTGGGSPTGGSSQTGQVVASSGARSLLGGKAGLKLALLAVGVSAGVGFSALPNRERARSSIPQASARVTATEARPAAVLARDTALPSAPEATPSPTPRLPTLEPSAHPLGRAGAQPAPSRLAQSRDHGPARSEPQANAPSAAQPSARVLDQNINRLEQEGRALSDARAALRRGDAISAQRFLAQAQARFPEGSLRQEREALAVEVIWIGGQRSEARRRAQDFLKRYPQSPYAARIGSFAQ